MEQKEEDKKEEEKGPEKKPEKKEEEGAEEERYRIKTMKRDLARIRLSQAEEERKKIIGLQEEPEKKKKEKPEKKKKEEKDVEKAEKEKEKEEEKKEEPREKKLEGKRAALEKELASLREKEKQINKRIQELEREKRMVKSKEEEKELKKRQEEQKEIQRALQKKATEKAARLNDLDRKKEEKPTAPPKEKKEKKGPPTLEEKKGEKKKEEEEKKGLEKITGIEKAKKRLEALTRFKEEKKEEEELTFRKSLEERWKPESKEPTEVPPEVKKPVKGRKKYPEKPSRGKRNWVRILIIFGALTVLAGTGAFIYYFFFVGPTPVPPPPAKECTEYVEREGCEEAGCYWYEQGCHEQEKEELSCEEYEEENECEEAGCYWYEQGCHEQSSQITPPQALIPPDKVETLSVSGEEEIREKFKQVLEQDLPEGEVIRILFKDEEENRFLGFWEFLEAFSSSVPQGLRDKLDDQSTIFLYRGESGVRFGVLTRVEAEDEEDVYFEMRKWEETIEDDLDRFFKALGKKDRAGTNIFEVAEYKGIYFRYLSFPSLDFGVCWATYQNRLIITTSGSTMIQTIDLLKEQNI